MKKLRSTLFYLIFVINVMPVVQADDVVDDIKQELKKCELSFHKDFFEGIAECLSQADVGQIDFQERAKAGLAMVMCVKRDMKEIPKCINKLSEYILNLKNTKYRDMMTCSPFGEFISFQDLIDLEDNAPVVRCRKPFGDNPKDITKTLTKHELVEYVLDSMEFILVDGDSFFYSIKELEIYFKYMKALYKGWGIK